MTLTPRFDSANPNTRKIMYWICDKTGRCYDTRESALAGSKPKSRIDTEKSLTELILGDKPFDN